VFSLVKRPGHEADHSPQSSAEVKNAGNYTSASQYALMAWCSVEKKKENHRDNFSFTFHSEQQQLEVPRGKTNSQQSEHQQMPRLCL
jgi:hypothetical protein